MRQSGAELDSCQRQLRQKNCVSPGDTALGRTGVSPVPRSDKHWRMAHRLPHPFRRAHITVLRADRD